MVRYASKRLHNACGAAERARSRAGNGRHQRMSDRTSTTVDVHTHVIPAALVREARTPGGLFGVRAEGDGLVHPEGYRAPLARDFHDADAILARMDANGIDVSVLSLSPTMFFYDQSPADAAAFARLANDAIAELAVQDERLLAVAQLPLQDPGAAVAELERAVGELGMRGALIGTNVGSRSLDEPDFEPVLAAAQRLGVPVELHPYFTGPKPRLEPFYFTNTIGNPLDTCIAAARLIHAGTFDRLPQLQLVLAHGGGYLPYQLGRLDHAWEVREEPRAQIARRPSDYLRRFWIDTLTHGDEALAFLARLLGADRLLVGTDLPYDMADTQPLERLRRVGLDAGALGAAALELFGAPQPAPAANA